MGIDKTNLQFELDQFTGDLVRYRHSLNRQVIYTPGIKYLAEEGEACWLIDAIALYFASQEMKRAMAKDRRLARQQFWHLEVNEDYSAKLFMVADSGVDPAIEQVIPYTDFVLDSISIWATGYRDGTWTLYLPSEY